MDSRVFDSGAASEREFPGKDFLKIAVCQPILIQSRGNPGARKLEIPRGKLAFEVIAELQMLV